MTICRSIGGRTTADSCRVATGTTLLVVILQVHKRHEQNAHRYQIYIYRHVKHINLYVHCKTTHRCMYSMVLHHKRLCSHGVHTVHTQLCLRIYININGLGSNINMLQQTCTAHTEHIVYFNINIHLCMNITFLLLIVSSVPIEPMPLPNCDHTATSLP